MYASPGPNELRRSTEWTGTNNIWRVGSIYRVASLYLHIAFQTGLGIQLLVRIIKGDLDSYMIWTKSNIYIVLMSVS